MKTLRVLTVDDEPLARRRLAQALDSTPATELVGEAIGCADALAKIEQLRPDLVLLDIRMRDGSGLHVAEQLRCSDAPAVIFVTAFDLYAVRAFEAAAIDYILKPVCPKRLALAIGRARARLTGSVAAKEAAELRASLESLRFTLRRQESLEDQCLWVRRGTGELVRVALQDVTWLEAEDDYVRLHTDSASFLVRGSLRSLDATFSELEFVRVHRRVLARRSLVQKLCKSEEGRFEVELVGGQRLPVGRVFGKKLRETIRQANTAHN